MEPQTGARNQPNCGLVETELWRVSGSNTEWQESTGQGSDYTENGL